MGNSLLEQLKKSGLVDEKKAQQVKRSQYKDRKQKGKGGSAGEADEARRLVQEGHAEKVERDRLLNRQKRDEVERKAAAAQIRQLIEVNRVRDHAGDIAYNFADGGVVRKLNVSEQVQRHLAAGRLAIAKLGEGYELVPMAVAEKIQQRDPHSIILPDQGGAQEPDGDDPYADYKIPDDLMW